MTWFVILLNAIVFYVELTLPERSLTAFFYQFGIVPGSITHPVWARQYIPGSGSVASFLTYMFLHGDWMHFLGNMWMLWLFGDNVEDKLGHFRFLLFYFLCGIASGLIHLLFNVNSAVPALGASGAIAGIMGAYLVMFPLGRVVVFVPLFFIPYFFEVPAVIYLGIWFAAQLFSGTFSLLAGSAGGIAWWAHIGGFIAGILFLPKFRKRSKRRVYSIKNKDSTYYRYWGKR